MNPLEQDVSEPRAAEPVDKAALEGRIREAEPAVLGAPDQMHDTPLHLQGESPDCLLESARMAEERQTGTDPGLEAYKQPASEQGIYDPANGTEMELFVYVINERPDVQAELLAADGPEDIKDALDSGQSVIAGVDAYEFYKDRYNLEPNAGGHAVVVTGADQAPDGGWEFTVNDPNEPVRNMPIGGASFLRAWDVQGRKMITMQHTGGGW
jgi:hypothetical protein